MREQRRELTGRVVSDKMDKTVVVLVERTFRHARYGKVLVRGKKYKAHDEKNACRVGDLVRISEARPMSREKRWVVEEIMAEGSPVAVTEANQ